MNALLKMLRLAALLLALGSCGALGSGSGGVDLVAVADELSILRQDATDLALLAKPETQEKIERLALAALKVEDALRAAGAGGPVGDIRVAATAALAVADSVLVELHAQGEEVGDLMLYVKLARIALRRLARGETAGAAEVLEDPSGVALEP